MGAAAFSMLDALEDAPPPVGAAMKLGNKSGEAPPEMVEVGASGKLVESNDMAVRFEILGNELEKQREVSASRFAAMEASQDQVMASSMACNAITACNANNSLQRE